MIVTSSDGVRFHVDTRAQTFTQVLAEQRYAASKTADELLVHGDYRPVHVTDLPHPPERRCLCGASIAGQWTAGVHHGQHRCARVITRLAS